MEITLKNNIRNRPSFAGMSGLVQAPEAEAPPTWFTDATAHPTTSHWCVSNGARIHYRTWDDADGDSAGKQGLLFVHGGSAHSHWWDFIAPFFVKRYHVAALDLSGMGDSEHRGAYSMELSADELLDVCEHAGMLLPTAASAAAAAAPRLPIVVGHSFGGWVTLCAARTHGTRLGGVVVVDSPVRSAQMLAQMPPPPPQRPKRLYPTREAIIGRFSLLPPQPCENRFIMEHIARHSVVEVPAAAAAVAAATAAATAEGAAEGAAEEAASPQWTWKFDDQRMRKSMASSSVNPIEFFSQMLVGLGCRLCFVYGTESILCPEQVIEHIRQQVREHTPGGCAHTPLVPIHEAAHHLMLDQPLSLVTGIRAILADWEHSLPRKRRER